MRFCRQFLSKIWFVNFSSILFIELLFLTIACELMNVILHGPYSKLYLQAQI